MAYVRNEANFQGMLNEIFNDPALVTSILNDNYLDVANYNLLAMRRVIEGANQKLELYDEKTNEIKLDTPPLIQIGKGTYGEVYSTVGHKYVYKIIRTTNDKKQGVFKDVVKECVVQTTIANIAYQSNTGKQIRCAPKIYRFFKYNSATPGNTGFVIVSEKMEKSAESPEKLGMLDYTFYNFVKIIKAIRDAGIIYNHCDVKLDNLMYDNEDQLRLIDFGFSSIYFQFSDTGREFLINNTGCVWDHPAVLANPIHTNPIPQGYYIQKDIIHFLYTIWTNNRETLYNWYRPSYVFLIKILRYYGLSDGIVTTLDEKKPPNGDTFLWSYNFDTSIRRYLHKQRQNSLAKIHPDRILHEISSGVYPPENPDAVVILHEIKAAIESRNDVRFHELYQQLDNKNISYIGYPSVLQMTVDYQRLDLFTYVLRNGVNPNGQYSVESQYPIIQHILKKYYNDPIIFEFLNRLFAVGVNINAQIGPENIPILYHILLMNGNTGIRNTLLPIILRYYPRLDFILADGRNIRQLANATMDQNTVEYIERALQGLPVAGGRRKRFARKTRQHKAQKKKTRKQKRSYK